MGSEGLLLPRRLVRDGPVGEKLWEARFPLSPRRGEQEACSPCGRGLGDQPCAPWDTESRTLQRNASADRLELSKPFCADSPSTDPINPLCCLKQLKYVLFTWELCN